jgi:peroxiredoxin
MELCPVRSTALAVVLLLSVCNAHAADPFAGVDPYWILLHEPAVKEELKLNETQQAAYQKLIDQLDLRFFPLRNKPPEEAFSRLAKIVAEAQQGLAKILQPAQQQRLNEILMRRLGAQALLRDDVVAKMQYTRNQLVEIKTILDETQAAVEALEKDASEGKPSEPLEKKFVELKTDEQKRILAILKPAQQAAWRKLVGVNFERAKLGRPVFKAPELIDTGEWINSPPLALAKLRGKVVIVHFYACGCINCINNYPWYRQWRNDFSDKGAVLIGIHTPETDAERDLSHVRLKAADDKLAFPILIDLKNENWNAWGNSMWPSVYLIDKRGYLRHFWPGELNWQGNKGHEFMRKRIEELLAETYP